MTDRWWARVVAARSARLATVGPDGRPHIVPIVFAAHHGRLVTAVDHKPKRTTALRRISNIETQPDVSVLIDHYADDWTTLWWVRIDGTAQLIAPADDRHAAATAPLKAKYPQYADVDLGTAIVITVSSTTGWAWNGTDGDDA